MKKKQLFAGAAVLAMLSAGGASAATTVLAQDYDTNEDGTYSSAVTNATVTFLEDDETGTIVDPDDPDGGDEDGGGIDPVDPNEDGAELMISYASNLNFGTQSKQGTSWNALADKVYKTDAEGNHVVGEDGEKELKEVTPFVATKDSRGSSRKGWVLTAKQDAAFKDGKDELKGAEINLSGLRYAVEDGAPDFVADEITLNDQPQEVSKAGVDEGIGAWSLALGRLDGEVEQGEDENKVTNQTTSGVTLNVPSTSAKNTGTYSTTVTWELTADPTA
ncbi:WxL domain-containing protein [Enterococcus faecalis]|uniref:WxL domain-containing protein n=1 Tax=Enterococcus faecalis TaxID=1351 RepID=UPI0018832FB1|nr:WxL domain-containing protein [Enterococcus faecalis]MBF0004027.1 WxL domain-containing protein [Enterococcus faecalis]MBF0006710.1 WxL domain-containing protein [Enterococcus faecalis]